MSDVDPAPSSLNLQTTPEEAEWHVEDTDHLSSDGSGAGPDTMSTRASAVQDFECIHTRGFECCAFTA